MADDKHSDDEGRLQALHERYASAMHGVQSGVAIEIELGISTDTTPKQLRVGVNSAMVDSGAICELLERKGIATREEILQCLVSAAERERTSYEERLSARLGKRVTLG